MSKIHQIVAVVPIGSIPSDKNVPVKKQEATEAHGPFGTAGTS